MVSGQELDRYVEIDERWIPEWFEYGFVQLIAFLTRRADYEAYCLKNRREPYL